ncbi:MAG: MFS transporter [Pseudomonadota bacterium]
MLTDSTSKLVAPPVGVPMKMAFGLGSTAEAIVYTTTSSFLLLFYNQVLGLPAEKVGLALSLGLIVNALFDPLVGSWSDRTKSRIGRRHPFMFASILPAALCFYFLFNPPSGLSEFLQLFWLAAMNVMLLQCMTLFHTPHLALGAEMSDDYLERSSIMSYNTFFLWIGDTLGWVLCFAWFFRAGPGYPNGALDPTRWPVFSASFAVMIIACLFISSMITRKRIPYVAQAKVGQPRFGMVEWMRDMGRALTNRNYVVLLIGFFFLSLMNGVRGGLWLYGATFFWGLKNDQIAFFAVGSLAGYLFGSAAVTALHRRFEKRWTGAVALAVYSIGPAIPLALGYFGVLGPNTTGLLFILIAFSTLQHAPYSIMTTTVYSALADIADENELKYGIRQEGILYSTRTLFARVDQALGTALAGFVLSLIAFPAKAVPGEVPQTVLMALAAAFVLSAVPGLIAAIFYAMLRVTRKTHDTTKAALVVQRQAELDKGTRMGSDMVPDSR